MGDLMAKHSESQKTRRSPYVAKPPPVPLKDGASPKPIPRKPVSGSTQRGQKRLRYDGLNANGGISCAMVVLTVMQSNQEWI
jgi:hypothetical protein